MKKSTFEQMDGTYREEGDHLLPNLTVPGNISVGIWGKRRRRYLRKDRQTLYTALLFGGKLDTHLAEIDRQAENMFSQLVSQMTSSEGVNEQLKAEHEMEWVKRMSSIHNRAEELVYHEYICC